MFKLLTMSALAAIVLLSGHANAKTAANDMTAASQTVDRWKCVHIPGAGTYCGEDGYNDDPKEQ